MKCTLRHSLPKLAVNHRLLTLACWATAVVGAQAASDSWKSDAAGSWNAGSSWTVGYVPGNASGVGNSNSTDVATFATALTADRIVTVDANRNIGGITFSNTSTNKYTLQSGGLLLSSGGTIQRLGASGAHNDQITTPITIMGDGGSASFTNNATLNTSLIVFTGNIKGMSSNGNFTTLTLAGSNTGVNTLQSGTVSDGTGGGKLAIVKNDTGQWRLAGNNTFSGGVTLNAGTLGLGTSSNALGFSTLTINGGTLSSVNGNLTYTNTVVINNDCTLLAALPYTLSGPVDLSGATRIITTSTSSGNAVTLSGTISNGGLSKAGTGTLSLSGANTYSSDTTVSAGTLRLGAANVIPNGAAKGNVSVAGTLDLNGNSETINGLSGAGTVTNGVAGTQTLTVGDNDQSGTFSGKINAGIGDVAINKVGSGTVQLSGTCTYSGGLTINNGVLASANSGVGFGTITLNGGALASVNNNARTWANTVVVDGDFTLGQAVTFTGALILSGTMDLGGGTRTITVSNTPVAGDTLSGVISNGGLIKAGPGLLNLSGTNTFSGSLAVSNGVLSLTHAQVLTATNDLYIASGASFKLAYLGTNTIRNLYVNGERMFSNRIFGSDKSFIDPSSTGYLFTADGVKPKGTLIRVQ